MKLIPRISPLITYINRSPGGRLRYQVPGLNQLLAFSRRQRGTEVVTLPELTAALSQKLQLFICFDPAMA